MTIKVKIVDATTDMKAHAEIEIIAGSEQELKLQLENKDSNVNILINSMAAVRGVVLDGIVIVIVVAPVTIVYTMEMMKKRLDFLQLTPMPCNVMVDFCNGMKRIDMEKKYGIGKDGILTHFKTVFAHVGIHNRAELKDMLTYSDEEYILKYYEKIEAHRMKMDTTYKKRKYP